MELCNLTHLFCADQGCNNSHKCFCISAGLPCSCHGTEECAHWPPEQGIESEDEDEWDVHNLMMTLMIDHVVFIWFGYVILCCTLMQMTKC